MNCAFINASADDNSSSETWKNFLYTIIFRLEMLEMFSEKYHFQHKFQI